MGLYLRGLDSATNRPILQKSFLLRPSDNFPIWYVNDGVINVGTGRCVVAHVNDNSDRILAINNAVHSLTVPPSATTDETLTVYACSNGTDTQFFITEKSDLSDRPTGYDWVSDRIFAIRLASGIFPQFYMRSDREIVLLGVDKTTTSLFPGLADYEVQGIPNNQLIILTIRVVTGLCAENQPFAANIGSPLNPPIIPSSNHSNEQAQSDSDINCGRFFYGSGWDNYGHRTGVKKVEVDNGFISIHATDPVIYNSPAHISNYKAISYQL